MLDQLSQGRLELGIGRGVLAARVAPLRRGSGGIRRAIYNEVLDILVAGLDARQPELPGQAFPLSRCADGIEALSAPPSRILVSDAQPRQRASGRAAGIPFLVYRGPPASIRDNVALYRQSWAEHRNDPGRLNAHVADPRIGVMCQVVVAETDTQALDAGRRAFVDFNHSILKLWHTHGDHSVDALFDWDLVVRADSVVSRGSPATVRATLARLVETTGCNYVIPSFAGQPDARAVDALARAVRAGGDAGACRRGASVLVNRRGSLRRRGCRL